MNQAGAKRFVARTVLDLRQANPKYVCQTLLLAASWHRHARADADLEVMIIGGDNPVLVDFLDTLGVHHARIPPCSNDGFSRHANKIEGAAPDPVGRRVLLLDNDTCFLGGIADLAALPVAAIAAAEAGNARVSDEQWRTIREELGLPLLRREWAPLNESVASLAGQSLPSRERWLYLNSGVILFPAALDPRPSWLARQRAIYRRFRDDVSATDAVTSSDQAGFACSVAAHGEFAWLPARFHYRPPCFCLGLEAAEDIRILHFTADIDNADRLGIAARIDDYWKQRILPRIDSLPPAVASTQREWRRTQAETVLAGVSGIARDYDLDVRQADMARARIVEAAT